MVVAAAPAAPAGSAEAHDLLRRGQVRAAAARLATDAPGTTRDALLLECHLATGDLRSAQAVAAGIAGETDPLALLARAELAVAHGDAEAALERFTAAGDAGADALGLPWRPGAALALLRLDRRAEALDLAHRDHDLAVAHGSATDVARALRTLAACDTTTEAWALRAPRLRQALGALDGTEAARLRAQVEADLASVLLLQPGGAPEALVLLRRVESYAGREGLAPLHGRARRLLERMGEEPRRLQSEALATLTAAERRVAALAIEGLSNRAIAEHLVVSIKAVEGHLSKTYRKLGLASRVALVSSFNPG